MPEGEGKSVQHVHFYIVTAGEALVSTSDTQPVKEQK